MSKKKLMVLGAGVNQLPLIKKAVKMDFFVITVDNIPGNIGHKYSHQFINCSTVCEEEVLKAAKPLNINGIITIASDIATPAAALGYILFIGVNPRNIIFNGLYKTGDDLQTALLSGAVVNLDSFQEGVEIKHISGRKEDDRNHPNEKFLEVLEPFFKKVLTRRRQK